MTLLSNFKSPVPAVEQVEGENFSYRTAFPLTELFLSRFCFGRGGRGRRGGRCRGEGELGGAGEDESREGGETHEQEREEETKEEGQFGICGSLGLNIIAKGVKW